MTSNIHRSSQAATVVLTKARIELKKCQEIIKMSQNIRNFLLLGMFAFVVQGLIAQDSESEANRRGIRGSGAGETDPGSTGGEDPLGSDPGRSESGRPGSDDGGAGEAGGTDVDDPFANDPNGGAGEGENTEVDDPFANDPFGGAGSGGGTETGQAPNSSDDPLRTRGGNPLSRP